MDNKSTIPSTSKTANENILLQKSFAFAIRVVKLYKYLMGKDRSLKSIFEQFLDAGTSVGANVSEAQSASSKKDFVNKLLISLKESRESHFWLRLFFAIELLTKNEFKSMITDCEELEKLLTSSIKTARRNS